MAALPFALAVMDLMPLVLQGVAGASELFGWGRDKVAGFGEDGKPTDADWQELNTRTAALRGALHQD